MIIKPGEEKTELKPKPLSNHIKAKPRMRHTAEGDAPQPAKITASYFPEEEPVQKKSAKPELKGTTPKQSQSHNARRQPKNTDRQELLKQIMLKSGLHC